MGKYTVSQAAEKLGISKAAVVQRIKARNVGKKRGWWWELNEGDIKVLREKIPRGWYGMKMNRVYVHQSNHESNDETDEYLDSSEA